MDDNKLDTRRLLYQMIKQTDPPMPEDPHAILYQLVAQHNDSLVRMEQSITNMVNAIQDQEVLNNAYRQRLDLMVPGGDHEGHRRWHEAEIKRIEARSAMLADLKKSVAKWGLLALLGWGVTSMWHEATLAVKAALDLK